MGEGTGGYPGLGYERIANQVNGYSITLQYQDQLWKRFVSMTDEIGGSFEWDGQDRGDCLGRGNYRSGWATRGI